MTGWGAAILIGLGAAAVGEGIWLNGKIRVFLTYAEQLLNVGAEKVAAQPGKSAVRDEPATEPIDVPAEDPLARFTFRQPGDAA